MRNRTWLFKEREEVEIIHKKRSELVKVLWDGKRRCLYDEGTPYEKWLVSVIVEQLDDTKYRLYFPDDDVSDLGTDEFEPIETEKKTQIGKKVLVA